MKRTDSSRRLVKVWHCDIEGCDADAEYTISNSVEHIGLCSLCNKAYDRGAEKTKQAVTDRLVEQADELLRGL